MSTNNVTINSEKCQEDSPMAESVWIEKIPLHKNLVEKIEDLEKQIHWVKQQNHMMAIVADLEKSFPAWYFWATIIEGSEKIYVNFNFTEFSQALEVLKFLAKKHDQHQKEKCVQDPEDKSMRWYLGTLVISGSFSSEAAKCKFVQTGTKTVPVYEMQCEDNKILTEVG